MVCDAIIGQDVYTWERKNLVNSRFQRQQDQLQKIVARIAATKLEISKKLKMLNQKVEDQHQHLSQDLNKRLTSSGATLTKEIEGVRLDSKEMSLKQKKFAKDQDAIRLNIKEHIERLSRSMKEQIAQTRIEQRV